MYKTVNEDEGAHCLECGEPLYGRTDKKFCSCGCKNKYHGSLRAGRQAVINAAMRSLERNYRILESIYMLNSTACPIERLTVMGFQPDFVTHRVRKNKKHLEYRCFDFVYNLSSSKLFNLRRL